MTVLRAIANSGYAEALPKVIPYLTDDREQIRVDAVRALQSIRDPRVDELVIARLQDDSSSSVQMSAIAAAQLRDPSDTLVRGLETAGISATDPHVRHRAVEVMIHWLVRRPDLRSSLEKVARDDKEPLIRERAKTVL